MLAALAVAGLALSLAVHAGVMPHTSGNADEVVYRFQAEMYRHGDLTIADDGPVFRPWMSGVIDGDRLMVFPPGWPAVLALGLLVTGSTTATVALVMALLGPAAWWFLLELTGDRRVAAVGGALLLASPFVVVHSGTLLSYLPALTCELVFGASVLRAVRTRRFGVLAAGGAALGVLFALRPLDAGLIAVPFGVYALVCLWRDGPGRLARAVGAGALGAAVPVVLTLAYNAQVSGSPLTFPIEAAGGNNAFGFGPRNIAAGTPVIAVTAGSQVTATLRNLAAVPQWMPGSWLGLPFLVIGAVVLWRASRSRSLLLAGIAVLFPLVYVVYWGTWFVAQGRGAYGPFYYASMWMPLTAAVASGLVWSWERVAARVPSVGVRRVAVAALAGAALVVVAVALRTPLRTFHGYTDRADAQLAAASTLPAGSFAVLPVAFDGPWILYPWNQYANTPDLDGNVVYGADAGDPVIDALARYGDRPAYGLLAPHGPGNAGPLAFEPLTVRTAPAFRFTSRITGADPAPLWSFAATEAGGARCTPATDAGGTATVVWEFATGVPRPVSGCAGPVEANPPVPPGQRGCAVGTTSGTGRTPTIREERFWCRLASAGGAPMTVVAPGEPRVGRPAVRPVDGRLLDWTTLTRPEADAALQTDVEPVGSAPPAG